MAWTEEGTHRPWAARHAIPLPCRPDWETCRRCPCADKARGPLSARPRCAPWMLGRGPLLASSPASMSVLVQSSCFFVHPPVLSLAPVGERNHGHATVRNGGQQSPHDPQSRMARNCDRMSNADTLLLLLLLAALSGVLHKTGPKLGVRRVCPQAAHRGVVSLQGVRTPPLPSHVVGCGCCLLTLTTRAQGRRATEVRTNSCSVTLP